MLTKPIFITGCYRSGTTYLSRIVDSHRDISIVYDTLNYFRFHKNNTDLSNTYKVVIGEVCERLKIRYDIIMDSNSIINRINTGVKYISHKQIYSAIMEEFFRNSSNRLGEKALLQWSTIPFFLNMFTDGKAIHIIRDPRDVVASFKFRTFEAGKIYMDAIFATMHSMESAMKYRQYFSEKQYLLIKYEDLIIAPVEQTKTICDFLEIDFDKEMLDDTNYKNQYGEKFDSRNHSSFKDDSDQKSIPIGRWEKKLDEQDIKIIEGLLYDQMEYFNYKMTAQDNYLKAFVDILRQTPLLMERFINLIINNIGTERYPSNPRDPKNWNWRDDPSTVDTTNYMQYQELLEYLKTDK